MKTLEDVDKWVKEHHQDGDGVDHLRKTLKIGLINGSSAAVARAWLDEHENGDQRRLAAEHLELAQRSTTAAEHAAAAAAESAQHAAESVKWSKVAAVIAVTALVVSAWPYIKDVGRSQTASLKSSQP